MTFRFLTLLIIVLLIACQSSPTPKKGDIDLSENWWIANSAQLDADVQTVVGPTVNPDVWYRTGVPSTVLAALVKNNVYKNIYFGKNLIKIPAEQFENSWWYKTDFFVDKEQLGNNAFLNFDGINYRANIWLNGKKIAAADTIFGSFRKFQFDITGQLRSGKNILAVEVFPPRPGDFTLGFVDWNPRPPDNNMGIWRPVTLHFSGPVSIKNTFVQTKVNLKTLKEAELYISTELSNHSNKTVTASLNGQIDEISFNRKITLQPRETRLIKITPQEQSVLKIKNPRLWWPNNYGQPELYQLQLRLSVEGRDSDYDSLTFGIREVEDYFTKEGYRGYKINGRPILIKGGGWVDDLLLADTPEKLEAQVKYAKHMNLNTLRLEGFWGKDHTLYNLCDRYGLLIMVGWSCQWEWEEYVGKACDDFGGIKTDEEIGLIVKSWNDQITMFRNHPSILVWLGGSDKLPRPALEKRYLEVLKKIDPSRPYLAAAGGMKSEISGPTGVKMNGPYAYTPPVYWYEDKENGGAFGFNTETGPGPQVPPLESIKKMIPQEHLWPIDHYWEYHCGRNNFNTLNRFVKAMNERYGQVKNPQQFAKVAQVMNYELIRPMFEAFAVNKTKATGIIQWMFNSAWPEMYWQLFDSYLMPNGAFYGVKKAAHPLHLVYNYDDKSIYAVNQYFKEARDLKAVIKVINIDSKEVWNESLTFELGKNSVKKILPADVMGTTGMAELSETYFLSLKLLDTERREISNNFYWLSQKADIPDYARSEWYYTPIKQYGDFKALHSLPQIEIEAEHTFVDDANGWQRIKVKLHNPTDVLAFFIELKVEKGASGQSVLPIFWDDNYITLLPGERKSLSAKYKKSDLDGNEPVFKYSGWNVKNN